MIFSEENFAADSKGRTEFRIPSVGNLIMQLEKYNDDCAMNLPFAIKMREKIDAERLENALNRVIAENDVLRVVACHRKSVAAEDECFDNLEGIFMSSGSDDGGTEGIRVRFLKEYHYSLTVREVEGKTYVERVRNALQTVNSDIRTRMDIESNIPARRMVTDLAEVVRRDVGHLLLYVPVVHPEEFDVAISYLVRRLEENAAPANFMSGVFDIAADEEDFNRKVNQDRKSVV